MEVKHIKIPRGYKSNKTMPMKENHQTAEAGNLIQKWKMLKLFLNGQATFVEGETVNALGQGILIRKLCILYCSDKGSWTKQGK